MDEDTVIRSVQYRCWMRGETYEEFVSQYCSDKDLLQGMVAADRQEAAFAAALWEYQRAYERIVEIAKGIPERSADSEAMPCL